MLLSTTMKPREARFLHPALSARNWRRGSPVLGANECATLPFRPPAAPRASILGRVEEHRDAKCRGGWCPLHANNVGRGDPAADDELLPIRRGPLAGS